MKLSDCKLYISIAESLYLSGKFCVCAYDDSKSRPIRHVKTGILKLSDGYCIFQTDKHLKSQKH
jgi:hypothetical protein